MESIFKIIERLKGFENNEAIFWNNKHYLYSELSTFINEWLARFNETGIEEKEIVAFYGEYSPQICGLIYA